VFNWFQKTTFENPLVVDMHSHLLPALDDGVQNFEDALSIIRQFAVMGYKKLITTPHIMSDAYRNSPQNILPKLAELNAHVLEHHIDVKIEAAAEYYLDESLMQKISSNETLLTMGKKMLLFETGFLSQPLFLNDFIFSATTKGYQLILAHPERYMYLQEDFSRAQDLLDRGLFFQVNLISLTGYYSKPAQKLAEKLIDKGQVHFLASDCHTLNHTALVKDAFRSKYFKKAISLPLLNNMLL
jgi:protein-tyrosine phosphatase